MTDWTEGQEVVVPYPFVRATYSAPDEDGPGCTEVPTWKPGARFENDHQGSTVTHVDGLGEMVLRVVSVHKPGKYPVRVFFTRRWRNPDGVEFGKGALRVTTRGAFTTMAAGYRFWREVDYIDGKRVDIDSFADSEMTEAR